VACVDKFGWGLLLGVDLRSTATKRNGETPRALSLLVKLSQIAQGIARTAMVQEY